MTIEIQFNSVTILSDDMLDIHPLMLSSIQQYLPAQKTYRRRKIRKKRETTVGELIDVLIDSIDRE